MSLLTPIQPAEPTREVKLRLVARDIKQMSFQAYKTLCQIQKGGINKLWHNPEFTPQEIINALGEDAVKVFQYHGALTEYIGGLANNEGIQADILFPPNAFEIENNTITVTEEPYLS